MVAFLCAILLLFFENIKDVFLEEYQVDFRGKGTLYMSCFSAYK